MVKQTLVTVIALAMTVAANAQGSSAQSSASMQQAAGRSIESVTTASGSISVRAGRISDASGAAVSTMSEALQALGIESGNAVGSGSVSESAVNASNATGNFLSDSAATSVGFVVDVATPFVNASGNSVTLSGRAIVAGSNYAASAADGAADLASRGSNSVATSITVSVSDASAAASLASNSVGRSLQLVAGGSWIALTTGDLGRASGQSVAGSRVIAVGFSESAAIGFGSVTAGIQAAAEQDAARTQNK